MSESKSTEKRAKTPKEPVVEKNETEENGEALLNAKEQKRKAKALEKKLEKDAKVEKKKSSKKVKEEPQEEEDSSSSSSSSSTPTGGSEEPPKSDLSMKGRRSKAAELLGVGDIEPGMAEMDSLALQGGASHKGLKSKLNIFKRRKEGGGGGGKLETRLPSDVPAPPPLPALVTPRAKDDKAEDEALAELLKKGERTTSQDHEHIDVADYLRSIVAGPDASNLGAGNINTSASQANIPAAAQPKSPLLSMPTLLQFSGGSGNGSREPISDSQAPRLQDAQLDGTLRGSIVGAFNPTSPSSSSEPREALVEPKPPAIQIASISSDSAHRADGSVNGNEPGEHETEDTKKPAPKVKDSVQQSSELGTYFYQRIHSTGHLTSAGLTSERKKERDRQLKKKAKEEQEKKESEHMKFTRDDGRFKYKGECTRIAIPDDKRDDYEITKFSHNAWSGARHYWVPDGEGKLRVITGEVRYIGGWKKGVRHGKGEGDFEMKDVSGVYSGDWKNGKPHGNGKFLTKRFTYEGGWKDGMRSGFGDYLKELLHYTGDWLEDKKHGYGIAIYADGTRFEGEWEADQRSGFGVCRYPDGSIYTGEWVDNQRHGTGTSIYSNGNRYVGAWYKDMKQGQGILYGALHQKLYEGKWWRNKRHGQGTAWFLETGDRYDGEWFLGKQHGEGDWTGSDGSSYKGSYVDGFRQGTGLVVYPSGDRYVGEWAHGIREGPLCAYVYKDYGKFVGPFVGDRVCGQGEYHTFANRKISGRWEEVVIEDDIGRYTGLVLDGKRYGRGIQVYHNGNRYDGEFRDGVRQGYGVMQYEDGGRYVGFWMKDQRSKLGTYSLPSGEKYVGRWLKDMRHGTGTMIFESKDRLVDAQWVDDAPMAGNGTYVFANKSVYRGPVKNGMPDGRGMLTVLISTLLRERVEYRKQIGLHFFLKGERKASTKDDLDDQIPQDEDEDTDDITAYVDSAKKNKKKHHDVTVFQPNTITFWREFRNGRLLDGPGLSIWDGNVYEGDFVGFERSGTGRMSRTTGETYYGQWKHDREWGIGEIRTRAQDTYVGHWYNGFRNGTGYQSYEEGGTFYGKWMNDRRHGIGLFHWPDKTYTTREYYKGELVAKRPQQDAGWTQKQLATWGVNSFATTIKELPFPFGVWAAGGMPEWYQQSLASVQAINQDEVPDSPQTEL